LSKLQQQAGPDDSREGLWTREQIEAMDADFVGQMERAIAAGQEHAPTSTER
jgi:hypothetical protein